MKGSCNKDHRGVQENSKKLWILFWVAIKILSVHITAGENKWISSYSNWEKKWLFLWFAPVIFCLKFCLNERSGMIEFTVHIIHSKWFKIESLSRGFSWKWKNSSPRKLIFWQFFWFSKMLLRKHHRDPLKSRGSYWSLSKKVTTDKMWSVTTFLKKPFFACSNKFSMAPVERTGDDCIWENIWVLW
jgi:hypothetical protein